jgi:FMNH2-dependent dimethyl sulfone monooxygenase
MQVGVIVPMAEVDVPGARPTWTGIRSFAASAEEGGIESLWVLDHFFHAPPDAPVEGMLEGWTTLAALAAVTERVRIGSIVLCAGFRHPGLLAKMAATADEVCQGRLILGLGAGWHDAEYEAFGFPTDRRVARLEETLRVVRPLLDGSRVTFDGSFVSLRDAVLAPPAPHRVPLLVAGEGPRMLRLAAEHADAWNTAWYGAPDEYVGARFAAFADALAAAGRDPQEVARTVGVRVAGPSAAPADDDEPLFVGSVDELARALDAYESLGADHLIVGLEPITASSLEHLCAALALRG